MVKHFEKLYKRDAHGKVTVFTIKAVGTESGLIGSIDRKWGRLDGKQQEKRTIVKSKNIGKSNFTTPYKQATLEAASIWRSKVDEGYLTMIETLALAGDELEELLAKTPLTKNGDLDDDALLQILLPHDATDAKGRIKPMLLHHLRLSEHKKGTKEYKKTKALAYPLLVQPKKDGVCCTLSVEQGLTTRGGKDRLTKGGDSWTDICPQIYKALVELLTYVRATMGMCSSSTVFHGEVYLHGHTLEEIQSACKKKNSLSKHLELHIFDVVTEGDYKSRLKILDYLQIQIDTFKLKHITTFSNDTYHINSEKALLDYEEKFLDDGYEGLVARSHTGLYKIDYRSNDVLKLVRFDEMELEIVAIVPMDNDPELGKFVCKYEGREFYITPGAGFDRAKRRDLLLRKEFFIGELITISHRGFTNKGLPRIATAKALRAQNDL